MNFCQKRNALCRYGAGLVARRWAVWLACWVLCSLVPADASPVLLEGFGTDPVAAGRVTVQGDVTAAARFSYDGPGHLLTANYDTSKTTAKLVWPLGTTFTSAQDFRFEVDFTIRNSGFFTNNTSSRFGQIAFGLLNGTTTGTNRESAVYDIAMLDYYPAQSTLFQVPALGPTVIGSDIGTGFASRVSFPFNAESSLKESYLGQPEVAPPRDVALRAIVTYQASTRHNVLQIVGPGGPLAINRIGGTVGLLGGPDGNDTTIENTIPAGIEYNVDSFALALWGISASTLTANVDFQRVAVYNEIVGVPEPAGWLLFALGAGASAAWRRRRGRRKPEGPPRRP